MLAAVNKLFADVLKRGWMTHDGVTLSAQPYQRPGDRTRTGGRPGS